MGNVDSDGHLVISSTAGPLDISGTLTLGAGSRLALDPAYQQAPGTSSLIELVTAADITGQFDNTTGSGADAHLGDGYFLSQINYHSARIEVQVLSALPGDANGDRVVDGSDFNIWNQFKFLTGTDWTMGDFNGDGVTDGADFGIWNANKFMVYDESGARLVVPEPGLVWMGSLILAALRIKSIRVRA
jgi:hypothetical protein